MRNLRQSYAMSATLATLIGIFLVWQSCNPAHAQASDEHPDYERVSVIGDSYCSGFDWADHDIRPFLDLHCRNGSSTVNWDGKRQLRRLSKKLERVVYISLGGIDHIAWIFVDDRRGSNTRWHPRRTAKRLRRIVRRLERRGHEVWVLGYPAEFVDEFGAAAMSQTNYCYTPRGHLGPDGLHLDLPSSAKRARYVVTQGCHTQQETTE